MFASGEDEVEGGLVDLTTVEEEHVVATVHGTEAHRVELACSGGALRWSCSWPYAADGQRCKHVVATGLTAIAQAARRSHGTAATATPVDEATLGTWFRSLPHDEVVALLLDAARDDLAVEWGEHGHGALGAEALDGGLADARSAATLVTHPRHPRPQVVNGRPHVGRHEDGASGATALSPDPSQRTRRAVGTGHLARATPQHRVTAQPPMPVGPAGIEPATKGL